MNDLRGAYLGEDKRTAGWEQALPLGLDSQEMLYGLLARGSNRHLLVNENQPNREVPLAVLPPKAVKRRQQLGTRRLWGPKQLSQLQSRFHS